MHSGIKNADTQTDDGGDVSAMRQYDAFGNPVAAWGGWQGPFGYGGPYGYQTDNDHGLKLLGHRYYEPDTGRFLTRDPIKDGRNWYGYCGGSPNMFADPAGLRKIGDTGGTLPRPIADSRQWTIIRFLWTLPNQVTGHLLTIDGGVYGYDRDSDSIIVKGGWFPDLTNNYVTVGDFMGAPSDFAIDTRPPWSHERVHREQSDTLGPVYVPTVIAGYAIGGLRVVFETAVDPYVDTSDPFGMAHDASPLEIDADARSGDPQHLSDNPFVRRWLQ